ncbi:hypothetical protein ACFQ3W_16905 [Paenibacillus puldeungensis]|uniref:Uncharacterized protein n=1 Tax=Paenibacillus puldeungensis TaxID=696536 RepID=A0ABW3S1F2_9BACL
MKAAFYKEEGHDGTIIISWYYTLQLLHVLTLRKSEKLRSKLDHLEVKITEMRRLKSIV